MENAHPSGRDEEFYDSSKLTAPIRHWIIWSYCELGTGVITTHINLSWSHKLFLRVNAQIGQRPRLDKFMIFCARWLIYVQLIVFVSWLYFASDAQDFLVSIFVTVVLLTAYLVSIFIGAGWKHRRPAADLPQVRTLIKTFSTWKSFPSDHTSISLLLALFSLWLVAPGFIVVLLFLMALLVAVGRIYVGVHYPRDIVGGLVLGATMYLVAVVAVKLIMLSHALGKNL